MLLESKAAPDLKDKDGRTALHLGASTSRSSIGLALIAAGGNLNLKDKFGRTPLMCYAEQPDQLRVLTELIKYGAEVSSIDMCRMTVSEP